VNESSGVDLDREHMDVGTERIGPGTFVAVIGASGVGKDTLLAYARQRVDGPVFVRRVITRPAGPEEDCDELSEDDFESMQARGGFAVSWHAHGLAYGLPRSVDTTIRAGGIAVANVSRTVLGRLEARYERLVVVRITASPAVRAARLAARGREPESSIVERLDRADPAPDAVAALQIRNDTSVSAAGERLIALFESIDRKSGPVGGLPSR
jgi:ribose 1,5-bisphosphokinase